MIAMNLNKDPSSWARVAPESVLSGSEAMRANVLNMAVEDIGRQAAEIERLRTAIFNAINDLDRRRVDPKAVRRYLANVYNA
jgi:hypothetical protein